MVGDTVGGMARSRAVVVATVAATVLGSVASGWWLGGAAPAAVTTTVVHVVDGDTIVAAFADGHTETVRVLGVDTPETVDPRKPVQCFGPEASAYSKSHLGGRSVRLEFDVERRDRYGRLLAYVLVDGKRYEDDLLRRGLARLLVIAPNGAHARTMLAEELGARRARRGLWGAC
jgi:micrococcal nuclease